MQPPPTSNPNPSCLPRGAGIEFEMKRNAPLLPNCPFQIQATTIALPAAFSTAEPRAIALVTALSALARRIGNAALPLPAVPDRVNLIPKLPIAPAQRQPPKLQLSTLPPLSLTLPPLPDQLTVGGRDTRSPPQELNFNYPFFIMWQNCVENNVGSDSGVMCTAS